LAIAKGIVEAHKGKIVAEETTGGGATFKITIPN
jgi:signal transduction histidine kinase